MAGPISGKDLSSSASLSSLGIVLESLRNAEYAWRRIIPVGLGSEVVDVDVQGLVFSRHVPMFSGRRS